MGRYLKIAIFSVFFIILIPIAWHEFKDGQSSSAWPTVTGTLVSAQVEDKWDHDSGPGYPDRHYYELAVTYSYSVNGKVFTGRRVCAGGKTYKLKKDAIEDLHHYKNMGELLVYYDPNKPASSMLEPGNMFMKHL